MDQGPQRTAPGLISEARDLGANVTALACAQVPCFGLGDGRVVDWDGLELGRHEGAVTALVAAGERLVSAGQDGKLMEVGGQTLRAADGRWVTAVATAKDRLAAAIDRSALVFEAGQVIAEFADHPSSVTGLAFDPSGLRLATSHYNGVTLWSVADLAKPERLGWAGSMTQVCWSPDGRYVLAATQERELHVWDLLTGRDFRLGGYQRKVRQMGWTKDGQWLATTGADTLVVWPIAGDFGAIPPTEIGFADQAFVTTVAQDGTAETLVAGYSNGQIIIGEAQKGTAKIARAPDGNEITTVALVEREVLFGTRSGVAGRIAF